MKAQSTVASRLNRISETAGEVIGSIIMMAIIFAIILVCFRWADKGLQFIGLTSSYWQSFGAWYVVGLACAFYWPVKYRDGMQGHWLKTLPELVLLGLAGPFALILGFPL